MRRQYAIEFERNSMASGLYVAILVQQNGSHLTDDKTALGETLLPARSFVIFLCIKPPPIKNSSQNSAYDRSQPKKP